MRNGNEGNSMNEKTDWFKQSNDSTIYNLCPISTIV